MVFILGIWSYFGNIQVAFFELSLSLLYVFIQVLLLRVFFSICYICKNLLFQDKINLSHVQFVLYGGIFMPCITCQIIMSTCQVLMTTCQMLLLLSACH